MSALQPLLDVRLWTFEALRSYFEPIKWFTNLCGQLLFEIQRRLTSVFARGTADSQSEAISSAPSRDLSEMDEQVGVQLLSKDTAAANALAFEKEFRATLQERATHIAHLARTASEQTVALAISEFANQVARHSSLRVLEATRSLNKTRELLQQSQKLQAVGQLASGIAHDFNNLLTAIQGHAQFLLEEIPEGQLVREDAEEILSAAARAAALTRQLLAFSGGQVLQPHPVNLNAVVIGLQRLLNRIIGENISIELRLDPVAGHINVDSSQIEQVIVNLIVNARDAMPNGGVIAVETSVVNARREFGGNVESPVKSYVRLTISDPGVGMSPEVQQRMFEPFFTTKPRGQGTGLGLATVHGIVTQSGGRISVRSQQGRGTSFRIYFPLVKNVAPIGQSTKREPQHAGQEVILVVDDERVIRSVADRILGEAGYQVLQAQHGGDALAILGGRKSKVDLVISDVVMPGIGGPELVDEVGRLWPYTRIMLMSGYSRSVIGVNAKLHQGVPFMEKPFTREELLGRVRGILDEPKQGLPKAKE